MAAHNNLRTANFRLGLDFPQNDFVVFDAFFTQKEADKALKIAAEKYSLVRRSKVSKTWENTTTDIKIHINW